MFLPVFLTGRLAGSSVLFSVFLTEGERPHDRGLRGMPPRCS
jgi:hypothetical protein